MPVGLGRTSMPIILFLARKAEGIMPITFRVCVSPATLRKASEAGPSSSNCAAAKVCDLLRDSRWHTMRRIRGRLLL